MNFLQIRLKTDYLLRLILIISIVSIDSIYSECSAQADGKEDIVSFRSLLKEMISRDAITRYPDPQYKFIQFSSYDRRSTEINDSTWFANSDYNQFIGVEINSGREETILMKSDKPGAVVRFWVTGSNHGDGTLRVYIDGDSKPVIEQKLLDFISRNSVGAPLSSSISPKSDYKRRGHNLYLPIPYSKSCKITYEMNSVNEEEWLYYCINAREYSKEADIESFKSDMIDKNMDLIKEVNTALSSNLDGVTDGKVFNMSLPIGEESSLSIEKPNQAINGISVKIKGADLKRALRDIIVKCKFDGEQTIWCPIGDLFGTGYELHPSETYYTKVEEDGIMNLRWIMPYRDRCDITFENIGNTPYSITGAVTTRHYTWSENSMYFHTSWRQYSAISTGDNKARIGYGGCFDMNFVTLKGRGVYVGDIITLFNTSLGGHWKSWWGEGDEKVYLDGEKFPSIIGTGSEDYYGYAWCEYAPFNHPYLAQPIGGGNFKFDMTVNMRYRGLDAMPFTKSIKFDMEMWHWTKTKLNFAPTTFYYMTPGGESNITPDYSGAKAKLAFNRFDILKSEPDEDGKLEGENMKIVGVNGDTHGFYDDSVSGGVGVMWRNGSINETRTFEFNADRGSKLKYIVLTSADRGAIFDISINGESIVEWDSSKSDSPEQIDIDNIYLDEAVI